MTIDQIRATFIEEANSLLEDMESLVLAAESGTASGETVDALFRCAHTIKGAAGMFGYDAIVGFTHTMESVLDRVRSHTLAMDSGLAELMLQCRDHVQQLVAGVANGSAQPDASQMSNGAQLASRLQRYLQADGGAGAAVAAPERASGTTAASAAGGSFIAAADGDTVSSTCWHISLRFHRDAFLRGINPAAFIAALGELGTSMQVSTLFDAMPPCAEMDPESCYLGFEIELDAACSKSDIEFTLEFAEGNCDIHIIPPRAKLDEYVALIQAIPADEHLRLGEILTRSGALTPRELERALGIQAEGAARQDVLNRPLGEIVVEQGMAEPPVVNVALQQQQKSGQRRNGGSQALKIPADRLDRLIDLVGELVIASSANHAVALRKQDPESKESASALQALVENIRDASLRLRMVPIGDTLTRFQRAVRDIAKELDKDIELVISGGDTELDKTVVELIADPLLHLVRNAADHGIETPQARLAAGKPARGRLTISARHESDNVLIEVRDDGKGLDSERIRRKAVERGLIAPEQTLSEQESFRLIFEPGFSTAEAVTNLSGRGVGMDVVKKNIDALRGAIELNSRPGEGTCVTLRLPLTLAIIDGFLVRVAGAGYVVPLDLILECRGLTAQDQADIAQKGIINLRGTALPVFRLREFFALDGEPPARENAVVVNCAGQRAGFIVDELAGHLQVVIKPLPELFKHLRGVGGSTILGDGKVAMILDIPGLIQAVARSARQSGAMAA
jgi:two-component system chemotaxis sensor kinase CheA